MGALAVISYLHIGYYRPLTFSMLVLLGFPLITLQTYFFSSEQLQFVGLSGWLHGLLVWGALVDTRRHFTSGWLILVGVAGKIGWENWQGGGSLTEQLIDARVATESHLWGYTTGVLLFGFFMLAMVRKAYHRSSLAISN
jgi:rhomboid family GlyGly-CTERM serine protease